MFKWLIIPLFLTSGATTQENLPPKAVLYTRDTCIYCQKVFSHVADLESRVEIRDIRHPEYREELLKVGHKAQVPCLVVNGVALYESDQIILALNSSAPATRDRND
jgi:glutaredoxin